MKRTCVRIKAKRLLFPAPPATGASGGRESSASLIRSGGGGGVRADGKTENIFQNCRERGRESERGPSTPPPPPPPPPSSHETLTGSTSDGPRFIPNLLTQETLGTRCVSSAPSPTPRSLFAEAIYDNGGKNREKNTRLIVP